MSEQACLLKDNGIEHTEILEKISENLNARLTDATSYTVEEIERVSRLDRRLFPAKFRLTSADSERIRALCALSKTEIDPLRGITSHRPLIGPLIVGAKRLLWRSFKPLLDQTFDGIQEYNSWQIYSQAAQLRRIKELEDRLDTSRQD